MRHDKNRIRFWLFALPLVLALVFSLWVDFPPSEGLSPVSQAQNMRPLRFSDPLPRNLFIELGKRINPTIAHISTTIGSGGARGRSLPPDHPFFDFFEDFFGPMESFPRNQPGPQGRGQGRGIGTGFIISADGYIVTNSHVIRNAQRIEVQLNEAEKFVEATVIGDDQVADVALLKIETNKRLPFAEMGDSQKTEVGEWVAAFGNPLGQLFSVTQGIISAKHRNLQELGPVEFMQTDAAINRGNSGGPLVNTLGQVIGVNTAIAALGQGIGFAIPINEVKKIVAQLREHGRVLRGFIGVEMRAVDEQVQQSFGLSEAKGALVMNVTPRGPAQRAGVQNYDVFIRFNNRDIQGPGDLKSAVQMVTAGEAVTATVLRNGKPVQLRITVGELPQQANNRREPRSGSQAAPGRKAPRNLGMRVAAHSGNMAQRFGIDSEAPRGPIVTQVETGSPAWQAGLRQGDIILDVNRTSVRTPNQVFRRIRKGRNVLRVHSRGRSVLIFLEVS